jgi:glucose/arabinose dehydrogenase
MISGKTPSASLAERAPCRRVIAAGRDIGSGLKIESDRMKRLLAGLVLPLTLGACTGTSPLPSSAGFGVNPQLPAPQSQVIPLVKIAPARGWSDGATPIAAPGLQVKAFARGLDHPRWLYTLPNGDVLVAETNAPPHPDDLKGLTKFAHDIITHIAGADARSANRITLLRDSDGDGVADQQTVFLSGLNSPFGMALIGHDLYVGDSDAVLKFPYAGGETHITAPPVRVADLPAGTINHHWTKNIIAGPDGAKLYVAIGSNSNAGENGLAAEEGRARVDELDLKTGTLRPYATGLRNPNGLSWEPETGVLWVTVNERDTIGNDLVPDYMTGLKDGAFYGFPFSYYGGHVDDRVRPQDPAQVARAIPPDYALGAHTASLGLVFDTAALLGDHYEGGVFVGQHGSWNRKPMAGYKVIFVPFKAGRPAGGPEDVLTGFLDDSDHARGRPVGVALDGKGALLVADDVGNVVWRVTPAGK